MEPVPKTMRAAALDKVGGPEALTLHELPVPELDPGQVLIAVHTAGVGVWDAEMRAGWTPDGAPPRFPWVLGADGSGVIAAVGSGVTRFKVGQPVWGYAFGSPKGGFYAEYVAADADKVAPLPERLDPIHAAAAAATGLTGLQGVDDALKVQAGEALVVHGATGAVGALAVQFAKRRGARVLATGSGEDGAAFALGLGADAAVDGRAETLPDLIRAFAPDGADAVLGFSGGESLERCMETVKAGGRAAYPNGVEPGARPRPGVKITTYDGLAGPAEFERLAKAVDEAKLQVPIDGAWALADAYRAHARLARGHVRGRLVLRVR